MSRRPARESPIDVCRGGRLCPPEQREALSFRASDRVTGVGIRPSEKGNGLPRRFAPRNDKVRRGGRLCPPVSPVWESVSPRTDKNWFRIFHKKEIILVSAQMPRITPESCGKNCQIRHFAQISRRMLADVPKFRKLREITCKRHAAVVDLHYTSLTTC